MATIKFLLKRKKNADGKSPIYIAIYDKDDIELISTKRFIKPNFWDSDNKCVKDVKNLPEDSITIQSDIMGVMRQITKIKTRLRFNSADEIEPTAYQIKKEYMDMIRAKEGLERNSDSVKKQGNKQVMQLIDTWKASLNYRKLTMKAVNDSMKKFSNFLKTAGQSKVEVKDLSRELIADYEKYLLEKQKLSDSSHGRHIKHLRWFLKTLKLPFNVKDEIKLRSYTKEIIALTLNELTLLEGVDVSYNKEYQRAKDMFLLGCYLGMRISDLKRISPATIRDKEIRLNSLKNNRDLSIPILPETEAILHRYELRAPRITEQALNLNIKEVCRLAGITSQVQITTTKAGRKIDKAHPKYKLISSHTASKTFITLAKVKWGLEPSDIAAIVGKDIATLLKHYFKNDNETAKQKMIANYKPQMAVNKG